MNEYFIAAINKALESVSDYPSVQAPAVDKMPFGKDVAGALDHILKTAEELGYKTKNLDGYCGYADVGEGESFGILGHVDVVPIGDGWLYPQGSVVSKGKVIDKSELKNHPDAVIYGRGILDDKGPMYICLYAFKQLLDEGFKPKYKVRFIFGANEETGWKCIDHYNKVEVMPKKGFSPDSDFPAIYAEKGIYHYKLTFPISKKIVDLCGGERVNVVPDKARLTIVADKPNTRVIKDLPDEYEMTTDGINITVAASGTSAHGSLPSLGVNAITKLLKIASAIDDNIKKILPLTDITGKECNIDFKDDASGALTCNIGVARVSEGKLSLTIDVRCPVTFKEEQVSEKLAKAFPFAKIELVNKQQPLYVDKNNELVKILTKAYQTVTGDNKEAIAIGGGTYARALEEGVAFGPELPGRESTIHMPNERAPIGDLWLAYKIYLEGMKNLLFK